jgi:hypothetical protein
MDLIEFAIMSPELLLYIRSQTFYSEQRNVFDLVSAVGVFSLPPPYSHHHIDNFFNCMRLGLPTRFFFQFDNNIDEVPDLVYDSEEEDFQFDTNTDEMPDLVFESEEED